MIVPLERVLVFHHVFSSVLEQGFLYKWINPELRATVGCSPSPGNIQLVGIFYIAFVLGGDQGEGERGEGGGPIPAWIPALRDAPIHYSPSPNPYT